MYQFSIYQSDKEVSNCLEVDFIDWSVVFRGVRKKAHYFAETDHVLRWEKLNNIKSIGSSEKNIRVKVEEENILNKIRPISSLKDKWLLCYEEKIIFL